MNEYTRHRISVMSPVNDYTGEAMLAFDRVCRDAGATPCGVTFQRDGGSQTAIFHMLGDIATALIIKREMDNRFPECIVALDPDANSDAIVLRSS